MAVKREIRVSSNTSISRSISEPAIRINRILKFWCVLLFATSDCIPTDECVCFSAFQVSSSADDIQSFHFPSMRRGNEKNRLLAGPGHMTYPPIHLRPGTLRVPEMKIAGKK